MAKPDPIFINMNGDTVRIDPPPGLGSNVRIAIHTANMFSPDGEKLILPAQTLELWLSTEMTKRIADALTVAADHNLNKMIG